MPARPMPDAIYDRLVEAFRDHGENWEKVGKMCGVQGRTARKAYEHGHPRWTRSKWAVPIKLVLDKERAEARARLAAQTQQTPATASAAKLDAAEQLAATATLVRNVRKAASACLGLVGTMVPGALELAKQLNEPAERAKLRGEDAVRTVQRVIKMAQGVAAMAETAQVMEHRELGKPTDILALQSIGSEAEPMTIEEAEKQIAAVTSALARAKEMGIAGVTTVAVPLVN